MMENEKHALVNMETSTASKQAGDHVRNTTTTTTKVTDALASSKWFRDQGTVERGLKQWKVNG